MSSQVSRLLRHKLSLKCCNTSRHVATPLRHLATHSRQFATTPSNFPDSLSSLSEIEQIVDSPVSFLGIEYLQNEEIFYLLENIQKLIGTKHPVVEFGAQTLLGSTGTFKIHGLITLLAAQIINGSAPTRTEPRDRAGILPKQRRLVEVCEMVSTAFFLHDNVVSPHKVSTEQQHNITKGNKLSLLFGDYFLSTACSQLASLEHPKVVDSVSRAIARNVEGRFWLETIEPQKPPGLADLSYYCSLKHGALMSSCCYSAALLAGHAKSSEVATSLQSFGNHVGQAIHLKKEIFAAETNRLGTESLSSYPFVAAVLQLSESGRMVDPLTQYNDITVRNVINLGHGVELTYEKCEQHCAKALDCITQLKLDEPLISNLASVILDIKSAKPIFTA